MVKCFFTNINFDAITEYSDKYYTSNLLFVSEN